MGHLNIAAGRVGDEHLSCCSSILQPKQESLSLSDILITGKVNVKLSPCLIKQNVMATYTGSSLPLGKVLAVPAG
jgi:hypothetical protein